MSSLPMIGVVVVNWFGGDRTVGCLASLEGLTWPAERLAVALVDNGSEAGFLDGVRQRFPSVRVVETGANLGFGGACNRGFEALDDCAYLALLNNDAIPDPGWLEPLVAVLEGDEHVGAATPKVLLDGCFVAVDITAPTTRQGARDPRELGVQLCGARVDGVDVSDRIELVSGFWGWEHDATTVGGSFAWTAGEARAHLPVAGEATATAIEVRLAAALGPVKVEVAVGGRSQHLAVDARPEWFDVGAGQPRPVVNNAGVVLVADGSARDRGYRDVDDGRYDEPAEVFGWSGAAVVLSRRYVEELGGFEPRFFLYYEDTDLSWRGRLRGWSYRYEPASVVHHEHSATVGDRSALAHHLAARNRLFLLVRCAPAGLVLRQVLRALGDLVAALHRDVVLQALHLRRPAPRHAVAQARVIAGFVGLLPAALRARRALGVGRRARARVLEWAGAGPATLRS